MMTKDEELAMDLALETLESIQAVYPCETVGKRITAIKQARSALVQEPVTEREQKIIMLAVHRFMSDAYAQADAAAQDYDNRYLKPGAVDAFYKDAKDAEALFAKLRAKSGGQA